MLKRKAKNLIIIALTVAVLLIAAVPSFAAPALTANKTVRMGFFEFGGMFEGAKPDVRKSGYCYEYMMQVSTYTGWKYEFVYGSYSELYEMLKNGEIDVLPYTNYNEQRGEEVLFSNKALAQEEYYIAVKPGRKVTLNALKGATITTLEGADYNALLLDYDARNGLGLNILYYPSLEETWDAVERGLADATVFTSNAYSNANWNCIDYFGEKPTYIAVAKDREDLLDELNEATNLIDIDNPAFLGELYSQYFSDNPMRLSLSSDEHAWVSDHPVIHVGGFNNDAPYLFTVDNQTRQATGLTVDVVSGIIEKLSLEATADYKGFDTLDELYAALDSGDIDVIIPFYPDFNVAEQNNLVISNNVRTSNMELVYLKGTSYADALKKVATPATKLGIYYVREFYPGSEIVGANSIQDAVDRVHSKEATGAIAQNVVLHNIKEKYDDLNYIILAEGCGTCFAARPENYALIRILNRGLKYFTNAEISAIASAYTLEPNVTTRAYLASHKEVVVLIVVVLVAIAALILMLLQMNKLKRKADAANKSKTEFLFNMSHDIRTPMNAILGYTEIGMRHADDPERIKSSLKNVKIAGGHLLNLINDILEMSRIEAGKLELTETPVDIRRAVKSIGSLCETLAVAKSIDLTAEIGDLQNPYIYADDLHMHEVLINLVSNAVKYTPEGGKVRYSVNQISDVIDGKVTYRIEVSDNGIGMSDEFQRHLFEAFTRENSSTVSKIEGTGLGLSIVKRIVDLAGGDIRVRSKLKEGSTFTVEMPFRVMDEAAIEKYESERKASDNVPDDIVLVGKRALLVEDNEMNRDIATEILTEAGLDIECAEDGELAVKTVLEKGAAYYDFILMDIQMPVMNGYEATKAIRALPNGEKIPIIALSANAFEEDKEASLAAGMNAHVAKPIDVKDLFAALAQFL